MRREALRLKIVKKYLYSKEIYGWKYCMRDCLEKFGACSQSNLFMCLRESMIKEMPHFYREVLQVWAQFLPQIYYKCDMLELVLNQPVFLNPKITDKGHMQENKSFMKVGLYRIKDYVYEVVPGFLPSQAILDITMEGNENMRKGTVINVFEKIKSSIPKSWIALIDKQEVKTKEYKFPEMYIEQNGCKVELAKIPLKVFYRIMLKKEVKRPTAEIYWRKVYPEIKLEMLWKNLHVRYNSIECEQNDLMFRHNRVYTKEVLHQIDKSIGRECDVCDEEVENLMHLYVECQGLEEYHELLKQLVRKNWEKIQFVDEEWSKIFLFGMVKEKNVKGNLYLLNMVLSYARYAVRLRRNVAYFDKKKGKCVVYFQSLVKTTHKDDLYLYEY